LPFFSCKTQNDLNKHINLKHDENRTEYSCDECEFKTKDVNSMKRHMLKFHMNNENALDFKDGQQFSSSYMCHVEGCGKVYCQGTTLSKHLKTTHNFQWPSGHSRFRYKLESDGFYRLQTLRYESIELVELLNKNPQTVADTTSDINDLITNEQETTIVNCENLIQVSNFSAQDTNTFLNDNNNDNNNANQATFVELEKVSIIQTDNKNQNQRIDFDLENFFTNSNLLNATNTNTNTINSDPATYTCINEPNNSLVVSNSINDYKMFSIERYIDDSSRF